MRRLTLAVAFIGFAAGLAVGLAPGASAEDTRNFLGDSTSCPSGAFTGQIVTTLNPAGTANTQASISSNPAACASNEILLDTVVGSTTTFSSDCEGDTYMLSDLTVAGADITGANSESINIGGTDATFKFIRNNTGIVTLTAADDDSTAALTVLPGGAAAMVLGGASMTALTVTTDGTGTGEVVLPNGSIGVAELARPLHTRLRFCGDATTVNNNTVYYGLSTNDVVSSIQSSATVGTLLCDTTAAGNTTEASVDGPAFTATAFGVNGMICYTDTPGATVSFTLRSATAGLTPAVTCSVATGAARTCVANTQTTTDIASAATFDLAVASTSDLGTIHFICDVDVVF